MSSTDNTDKLNKLKREASMSSNDGIVINFKRNSMINMSDEMDEINEQDVGNNSFSKQNIISGENKIAKERSSADVKKNVNI
jgi:hypothetical protein